MSLIRFLENNNKVEKIYCNFHVPEDGDEKMQIITTTNTGSNTIIEPDILVTKLKKPNQNEFDLIFVLCKNNKSKLFSN